VLPTLGITGRIKRRAQSEFIHQLCHLLNLAPKILTLLTQKSFNGISISLWVPLPQSFILSAQGQVLLGSFSQLRRELLIELFGLQ
jgi:hypothetical protein